MTNRCLLAIDASSAVCDVAVRGPQGVVSHATDQSGSHASELMASLGTVLDQAQLDIADLQGVVYGCGPGSFTGVRIGVAVAQGIAHAASLPMLPVSSLRNIAQQQFEGDATCNALSVAIDARMGEWYVAQFTRGANGIAEQTAPAALISPQQWLAEVAATTQLLLALDALPQALNGIIEQRALSVRCELRTPSAQVALNLADGADSAAWHAANAATPSYVRDKVAQTIVERQAR
ncbi:MAG: tRNA (adenosine(37)-N6)-threonylcarbamoyltransferase complex dimerization subunit type 1 TsaB [Pseudomonadota bacterium]